MFQTNRKDHNVCRNFILVIGGIRRVRLIAAIFADKVPHKPSVIGHLKRIWSQFGTTNITARDERNYEDNLFIITAEDEEAANSILDNSPWSAMGFAIHVQAWPPTKAIEDLLTHQIAFWIQIRGVPLYMFVESNVRDLVENFGVFLKMDDPLEGADGTYNFLRVRVLLDGRNPLPSGTRMAREDGSISRVEFKYEKLVKFCFSCGRLGHNNTPRLPCTREIDPQNEDHDFGSWMITLAFHHPNRQNNQNNLMAVVPSSTPVRRRRAGQILQQYGAGTVGENFQNQREGPTRAEESLPITDNWQRRVTSNMPLGNGFQSESKQLLMLCQSQVSIPMLIPSYLTNQTSL